MSTVHLSRGMKETHIILWVWLCCNTIIAQSADINIFGNDGLCCVSPAQCGIVDCGGVLDTECCRLNDDSQCASNSDTSTTNIYHGEFTLYDTDKITVYFRLYPDHIHFQSTLSTDEKAIGIAWSDYNHPLPDMHFSVFAKDKTDSNAQWNAFDIIAQKYNYTILPPHIDGGEHACTSDSQYCLPNPVLNFNFQSSYAFFHYETTMDDGDTVMVWERSYSVNAGLFEWNELYATIDSAYTTDAAVAPQLCWDVAVFANNTVGDGGEEIERVHHICTEVYNICEADEKGVRRSDMSGTGATTTTTTTETRICARDKVDLVLLLDVTLSESAWAQTQVWLQHMLADIADMLSQKEYDYETSHGVATDVLFRASLITYSDETFDVRETLDTYNLGNQRVVLDNLMHDLQRITLRSPNHSTTAHLKSALHVASQFVFPQNGENDTLIALLITDEVITNDADQPCTNPAEWDAFFAYNPLFGAVLIDEAHNDEAVSMFTQSMQCLFEHHSGNYSVVETMSSIPPSSSFSSLYQFVDSVDVTDLGLSSAACDVLVNVTWPSVDFNPFVSFNECVGGDLDLAFVIDLTPKYEGVDCFSCWVDAISSLIVFAFNLVQDVTSAASSLRVAVITFDGLSVNAYHSLSTDAPITDYPKLTQILSLVQSLTPVAQESDDPLLNVAVAEALMSAQMLSSGSHALRSFLFVDGHTLPVLSPNTSLVDVCNGIDTYFNNVSYAIRDYEALEFNLFPLHSIECGTTPPHIASVSSFVVIHGSIADHQTEHNVLTQLYTSVTHAYCPSQCYECDVPLYDASQDLRQSMFLQNWQLREPMTAGWRVTTSSWSHQQVIQSVDVHIYGLTPSHQLEIVVYDYLADQLVAKSDNYNGDSAQNKYVIELPTVNEDGAYNFLLPNHDYAINIRLYNVQPSDADAIQIVLQNVTDIYYEPSSTEHFSAINGLLFVYNPLIAFDVENNAHSKFTPFGSVCIVCVSENDGTTSSTPSTTTASPSRTTSATPTNMPSILPTSLPTSPPTALPTNVPTHAPIQPTPFPTIHPTNAPTLEPTTTTTLSPSAFPTATPTTSVPTTASPTTRSPVTNTPTAIPIQLPSTSPTAAPTNTPTPRPTPFCAPREPDPFCTSVCNHAADEPTEWSLEFVSVEFDAALNTTTFSYKASTSLSPSTTTNDAAAGWCDNPSTTAQPLSIIFLYISSCCEPSGNSQLRNITDVKRMNEDDTPLWGINGNHWILYPLDLGPGESDMFTLKLTGEYLITDGSYVASHKTWFDGSRPSYRCALDTIPVPDICHFHTKSPTESPTGTPTPSPNTNPTAAPTFRPTNTPTVSPSTASPLPTPLINTTQCPVLGWPDLQDDCEQYCLNSSGVEWEIAHISTLYNALSDTTTIAWSVLIGNNHWSIDEWCFPLWFGGSFNYPEPLKRFMVRFNECCANTIAKHDFLQMVHGVSDSGDFSVITDDDDMVTGVQWDNAYLQKGRTGTFFVTWKGNVTLDVGEYWFFGGNAHSRCTSSRVQVPDVCRALSLNEYQFSTTVYDAQADMDWYLQFMFAAENLPQPQRRRLANALDANLSATEQWIVQHQTFVCDDWIKIINLDAENVKFCNVTVTRSDSDSDSDAEGAALFSFYIDIIADQHRVNDSQIIRLKALYEVETIERNEAQQQMADVVGAMTGTNVGVQCQNLVVSEIMTTKSYKSENQALIALGETFHPHRTEFWVLVLGVIACVMAMLVWMMHKYYRVQSKMIDGSYPKQENNLIHEIEDLFVEQLYETNVQNYRRKSELNEQLSELFAQPVDDDAQERNNPLMDHPRIEPVRQEADIESALDMLAPILEGGHESSSPDESLSDMGDDIHASATTASSGDQARVDDGDASSVSHLSSNDDDDDDISLEICSNTEYKL